MFLLQLLHNKPIEIYLDSACNNIMNSNIRLTLINSRIIKTFFDGEYILFLNLEYIYRLVRPSSSLLCFHKSF